MWYSGSERHRNGVGILVDEEFRWQVVEVMRASDRLMTIKLVIVGFMLHVCSVYASQTVLDAEVKARFWEALDEVLRSVPSSENIVIVRDFNRHIRVLPGGYDDVHESFGFSDRNGEGAALLDFTRAFGLVVVNSSFLKKEDHLITFRSAIGKTQIDFLLLRKGDRAFCKDYKVIPSKYLLTQHRLLVMDLIIKKSKKRNAGEG
ncbi:craniofacial development protein 2-like [Capsicum annuum]|uniref:craniofacial development protein 2-like n=1 Tax=Capsicum annuum TaxID=4072 RepID=UPI001FB15D6E|nr:craniofacial development protein 2-like [Capsicum annuum]